MASMWITASLMLVASTSVEGEELPDLPKGCLAGNLKYSSGDLTGAVLGTLVVTLLLLALGYAIYRMYWRGRRGKHLVLVTDAERGAPDEYAFDNPCFRDGTPIGRGGYEKEPVKLEQKNNRWSAWSPLGALVGNRNEKRRALDDSVTGEPQVSVVSLRSHDFTGLGFNVCGNMRDGIFVKDVLHRGPASESGRITSGDRIDSIRISFRHMVFEDALTILSYASPYEVQLEVENPSPSSRPSTLIRTKRSSIEPADRICHPFYRSQSIADLAQIGKASLKPVQDMGGSKSPKPRIESWDEKRMAEYPTLKLSPAPTKETVKLEKTANPTTPTGAAIVKPERIRKPAPQANTADSVATTADAGKERKDVQPDSAGKHQRFGIRVLPDPKAIFMKNSSQDGKTNSVVTNKPENVGNASKSNPMVGDKSAKTYNVLEAERRENERNSMVEKSNVMPTAKNATVSGEIHPSKKVKTSLNEDTVDAVPKVVRSLTYDERGIDVGPAEEEEENKRKASIGSEQAGKVEDGSKKSKDSEGHSNVKLLLTKGLQNLKEKLHHTDKKKFSPSPEPEIEIGANSGDVKKSAPSKSTKAAKSESSDSDGDAKKEKKKSKPAKLVQQNGNREEIKDKTKKEVVEKDETVKEKIEKEEKANEGNIPTEMPENVRRAAMAARHNRRSLITDQVLSVGQETSEKPGDVKPVPREAGQKLSEASSPTEEPAANPLFPTVKYRIRKEESLSEDSSGDDLGPGSGPGSTPRKSNKRKAPIPPAKDAEDNADSKPSVNGAQAPAEDVNGNPRKPDIGVKVVQQHEKTNGDENIQTMEVHIETNTVRNPKFADVPKQQNSPSPTNEITNIAVENSTMSTRTIETNGPIKSIGLSDELTITVEATSSKRQLNSDSDSDAELDDQSKKGGTTIELNSSHITIHHSPSSEGAAAEAAEAEGARKAASMGDLSRLEAEQPLLERAVSLDLADGGAPGGKKRKAPLPPPPDLLAAPDTDDGGVYRKEPRLDSALDTFQRRRLKKSSDWGTMEDAVQQSPPLRKSLPSPTNIHVNMFDNEPTSLTISIGDDVDDSEVFLESSPRSQQPMDIDVSPTGLVSFPVASVRTFETTKAYVSSALDHGRPTQVSSVSVGHMETPEEPTAESLGSQRTILLIAPEPVNVHDVISTSQVTLSQPTSTGPSSLTEDKTAESLSLEADFQIGGSRLLGLIRSELRNGVHSTDGGTSEADTSDTDSRDVHTLVSSTPIARRDHRHQGDTVQSSHITSSDPTARNINFVSSTTREVAATSEPNQSAASDVAAASEESALEDSNVSVTSTSEAFMTAASEVDSTNTFIGTSDDDSTFELDSQPPELPTSPVPVLTAAYNPSSSMTYITEIQVTTMTPEKSAPTPVHNGESEEVAQESSEEIQEQPASGSHGLHSDVDGADRDKPLVVGSIMNGGYSQLRNNVTVTAIRNAVTSPDRSKIPMRIGTDVAMTSFQARGADISPTTLTSAEASHIPMRVSSGILTTFGSRTSAGSPERSHIPMRIASAETSPVAGNNGIGEKKGKAVRPPVPPRKSDSSVSSVITVDVPNSSRSPENAQTLVASGSNAHTTYGFSPNVQNSGGSKKYISFSSLTPRAVTGEMANRNSSSFEQWVFLDDSQSNGKPHNGTETSGDETSQHSTVVTMPISVTSSTRPPSVTHIVMDSKQSSGKRGSQ